MTAHDRPVPVQIRLLGHFQLVKEGRPVPLRYGGKVKCLLSALALRDHQEATRDALQDRLWPGTRFERASQSLNTLVHGLRQTLDDALGGRPALLRTEDGYRLNLSAGIEVDTMLFDTLIRAGALHLRSGDVESATTSLAAAVQTYRGDLCSEGSDMSQLIERERLRGLYLSALVQLADHALAGGQYGDALRHAQRLLGCDPCREDAHRVVMRSYARLGQRAAAMNQYRLCCDVLRHEFDAEPEPATRALFAQLRHGPQGV